MLKRLIVNSMSNVGTLFLKLGITFVMTPILIRNLGRYDYGIWEIVGATLGYMGMLDLGIRPTITRFAAQYIAQKDDESLAEIYSTAWFFLSAVGLFVAIILASWGLFFPGGMAEDPSQTQKYTLLMLILAGQMLIVFPSYAAESFMEANQEYYLKNILTIINSIIGSVLIWNLIKPGNALILLAGINGIGLSVKYILYCWYVYRKWPLLRPKFSVFSFTRLKVLFRFSLKTLVQGIAFRMETATGSIVIGTILGPAIVPLYSIPSNLINYIRMITLSFANVFMPYFSSLNANKEQEKIVRTYIMASKLTIAAVLVLVIGILGLGKSFLALWVGPEIAASSGPLIIILVAFTVMPLLNPYDNRYLTAIDKHGVFAKWQPVVAVANLGLSLIFIKPWGIIGVALAALVPALVFRPYLLQYCCRHLGISVGHFARTVWLPLVPPSLAMGGAMVLASLKLTVDDFGTLVGVAAGSSLLFVIVSLFTVLGPSERELLTRIIKPSRSQ